MEKKYSDGKFEIVACEDPATEELSVEIIKRMKQPGTTEGK